MSLPTKYDRRIKRALNLRAVWEPGDSISLGDIVTRDRRGIFTDEGRLSDFGLVFRKKKSRGKSLSFNAQGVSTALFQNGAQVDAAILNKNAAASVEVQFNREDSYMLRTPVLKGEDIDNLLQLGRAIKNVPGWEFRRFYIVWKVLTATKFTFLGSHRKGRSIKFSGKGSAVLNFLNVGATAGLTASGTQSLEVKIVGEGGPVVMGVARVRKNGRIVRV